MSREAGTHITLVEDADISICPWGNQCNSPKSFLWNIALNYSFTWITILRGLLYLSIWAKFWEYYLLNVQFFAALLLSTLAIKWYMREEAMLISWTYPLPCLSIPDFETAMISPSCSVSPKSRWRMLPHQNGLHSYVMIETGNRISASSLL